jgi:hypothetical protein
MRCIYFIKFSYQISGGCVLILGFKHLTIFDAFCLLFHPLIFYSLLLDVSVKWRRRFTSSWVRRSILVSSVLTRVCHVCDATNGSVRDLD